MKTDRKSKIITLIESDQIFFFSLDPDGSQRIVYKSVLDRFLSLDEEQLEIPKDVLSKTNTLMIFPDYWLGNNYYGFQSKKKSLIAPFVERKLKAEVAGLEEIDNFYGYTTFKASERKQHLNVFFLQDPSAYELYHRLSDLDLSPIRMTTPALLWQYKLTRTHGTEFINGGKGLVHLEDHNCYLYFFFMGQFLFSRRIAFPETTLDIEEKVNLLNYEVNQSFYLFSQKTKSGVDAIYLMSDEKDIIQGLSESLNQDIIRCEAEFTDNFSEISRNEVLDLLKPINKEFSSDNPFLSISYKPLNRAMEWRPIQNMGMAVGILLLVFLFSETLFLKSRANTGFFTPASAYGRIGEDPKQLLRRYSEALEKVTQNRLRPSMGRMMMDLCGFLPDQISIQKALIKTDAPSELTIEAVISAPGPEGFKIILSKLLDHINGKFKPNNPLTEKDIEVHMDRENNGHLKARYIVSFHTELPWIN